MYLKVDTIHDIYYEEFGNPAGTKILFIHGGPGLGFSEKDKEFFDSDEHHVIFYDQRGCGKSLPTGSIEINTTQHLISDIEKLLDHLGLNQVHIFAGSWGATLAVLFASQFPDRVSSLILRGFFSAEKETTDIFIKGIIRKTQPKLWDRVSALVPKNYQNRVARYYYDKIISDDEDSLMFDYEWSRYGLSLSRKAISEDEVESIMRHHYDSRKQNKIQLYYALNNFFLIDNYVYEQAQNIKSKVTIVHGLHDHLCPVENAWLLDKCIFDSRLITVDAGHSAHESEIKMRLLACINHI